MCVWIVLTLNNTEDYEIFGITKAGVTDSIGITPFQNSNGKVTQWFSSSVWSTKPQACFNA